MKRCVFSLRGVGCIFYEMTCGRPMFPGSTTEDQLHLIFKVIGTPTDDTWPGIIYSEEFRGYNFPHYRPDPLINHAPRSVHLGVTVFTGA